MKPTEHQKRIEIAALAAALDSEDNGAASWLPSDLHELQAILRERELAHPTPTQLSRWQDCVLFELKRARSRKRLAIWSAVAAAMLAATVGFFSGQATRGHEVTETRALRRYLMAEPIRANAPQLLPAALHTGRIQE